jgi:ketosteroid isomerase-like protein
MPQQPATPKVEEALRRYREALRRRDFDALVASYTSDAVIDATRLGGIAFEGRAAIREVLEDWIGPYEEHEQEAEDFRDFGNGVTLSVIAQRGRPTGSSGSVGIRYASVVTWADDLMERTTFYADGDQARAAAERLAKERRQAVSMENVEIVRRVYESWNHSEIPGPIDVFDDTIEYVNPSGAIEPGQRSGLAAFTRAVGKTFESWETWEIEPQEFRTLGENVAVALRFRARGRASGLEMEGSQSGLWTIQDGKVVRYEWFHDPADAFKALGRKGEPVSQENVETVLRVMQALIDGDIDVALSDIDDRATLDWSNSDAPDSGVYTGYAAWRSFLETRDEALGERHFDPVELLTPAADTVVLIGRVREQGRSSGIEVESYGAAVWTLREGKVVCMKIYQSSDEALRAVGLEV